MSDDFTKPLTWDHSQGQCYADPPHHTTFSKTGNEFIDTNNSVQESILGTCRVAGIHYDVRKVYGVWKCTLRWMGCERQAFGLKDCDDSQKGIVLSHALQGLLQNIERKYTPPPVNGKLICKECIDQSSVIAPMWFMFPHQQGKCSHCKQEKECVAIPVPDKQPTDTEIEVTAADRRDAIEFVYANDWRMRMFVRRRNQHIVSQIADSVLAKCNTMRATPNNANAVQFESRQQLKDAVGFWPIVIQMFLSVIIKLIIDYFINKQGK